MPSGLGTNASVTLPSNEFTMPVRCPNHPFRAANAGRRGRPCDHCTVSRALWPQRFYLTPHYGNF